MLKKIRDSILREMTSNKDYITSVTDGLTGPLRYYYWKDTPNFGDRLMPIIINHFFPDITIKSVSADNAELFGVGSVLTIFNRWRFRHLLYNGRRKNRIFWGSGMLMPDENTYTPSSTIVLIRGELSRYHMNIDSKIPLGDPGLLMSLIIKRKQNSGKIVIVPHFSDFNNRKLMKFKNHSKFEIVDVRSEPIEVIKTISSAAVVLGSSLHALIIADSYGIPNFLYDISESMDYFKYDDYYSATGREKIIINDSNELLNRESYDKLIMQYKQVANLSQIQKRILDSFPFKTMDDVVEWRKSNRGLN